MLVNNENEIVNFLKKYNNNKWNIENKFDDKFLLNISNALNEINLIDESKRRKSSKNKFPKRNSKIIIISNREDENKLSIIEEVLNYINF